MRIRYSETVRIGVVWRIVGKHIETAEQVWARWVYISGKRRVVETQFVRCKAAAQWVYTLGKRRVVETQLDRKVKVVRRGRLCRELSG